MKLAPELLEYKDKITGFKEEFHNSKKRESRKIADEENSEEQESEDMAVMISRTGFLVDLKIGKVFTVKI